MAEQRHMPGKGMYRAQLHKVESHAIFSIYSIICWICTVLRAVLWIVP
jgi:hypothetical protein